MKTTKKISSPRKLLILFGLLIIVSVSLFMVISPDLSDKILEKEAASAETITDNITKEEIKTNNSEEANTEANFDFDQVKPLTSESILLASLANNKDPYQPSTSNGGSSNKDPYQPSASNSNGGSSDKKFAKSYIIGLLRIPAINLNTTPIMLGVQDRLMWSAVGTLKPNQVLGEGNYAITGHHAKNKEILFGRLPAAKKGHMIYITDKEFIYKYKVYNNEIIHRTKSEVITDTQAVNYGKPITTLVTCKGDGKDGRRVIVQGEFIEKVPYTKELFYGLK